MYGVTVGGAPRQFAGVCRSATLQACSGACGISTKRLTAGRGRPSARKKLAPPAPPTPVRPSSRCSDGGCNLPSGRSPRRRRRLTSDTLIELALGVSRKETDFGEPIFSLPAERYPTNTCVGYWAGARPLARLPPPSHTLWPKPRRPAGLFICARSFPGQAVQRGS